MADIYAGASATIIAGYGDNARAGLPGVGTARIRVSQQAIVRGIDLATYYDVGRVLLNSKWSSRAWTFQEQHLARRCLIFTEEGAMLSAGRERWEESKYGSTVRVKSDFGLHADDGTDRRVVYARSVGLYTARELSEPADILNAYQGLLQVMKQRFFHSPYVHGLPISEIDFALHWILSSIRSTPYDFVRRSGKDGQCLFPSWSWAGWIGCVMWDEALTKQHSRIRWINSKNAVVGSSQLFSDQSALWTSKATQASCGVDGVQSNSNVEAAPFVLTNLGGLHVEVMRASFGYEAELRSVKPHTGGFDDNRCECIAMSRVRNNRRHPEEYDPDLEHDLWDVTQQSECDMSAYQGRDKGDISTLIDRWSCKWLDTETYDKTKPWCRYSVLLISRSPDPDGGPDLASRVGLGICHIDGFLSADPKWTRLQLV
ncbi:hypothetical protein LTR95_013729 [Oleoguttula sp. CCFEE 5521]